MSHAPPFLVSRPGAARCALALSLALVPGCGSARSRAQPEPTSSPTAVLPSPALARAGDANIADIAERVIPSVVNVATRGGHGPAATPGAPRERSDRGLGSGVVVADGLVLTNNHVIAEADEIRVTTHDKREFAATVVGTDPKSDLAVLRLQGEAKGLVPIAFGDSARLRLGDVVLAIGNPFGVGQTVTMGIVSAKGRADVGIVDYEDFIQTDAAINPGNSGGALVDMEGRLVGINTAILSARTGGNIGIGFAIPTNMARPIMDSLLANGRVIRGWLGVNIQDVDQEIARAMALPTTAGALVSDVDPSGPAARAGLRRGDVVLEVDGVAVDTSGRLRNVVAAAGAKKGVKIEIMREGKRVSLLADLVESPADRAAPAGSGGTGLEGLTLDGVTTATRQRFGIPAAVDSGVVVVGVQAGTHAARFGLREGDVILEVNRQRVDGVTAFQAAYTAAKDRALLVVWRAGGTFFLVIKK